MSATVSKQPSGYEQDLLRTLRDTNPLVGDDLSMQMRARRMWQLKDKWWYPHWLKELMASLHGASRSMYASLAQLERLGYVSGRLETQEAADARAAKENDTFTLDGKPLRKRCYSLTDKARVLVGDGKGLSF